MVWSVVAQVFSTLLELIRIVRLSEQDKDLEILVLRKQLAMAEARLDKPVRLTRAERLTLAGHHRPVEIHHGTVAEGTARCDPPRAASRRHRLAPGAGPLEGDLSAPLWRPPSHERGTRDVDRAFREGKPGLVLRQTRR